MWRVWSIYEIKWKCWMFFLKEGENLMIVLQLRFDWKTVLFGANTHIANVKEYRRLGYLPNLGPLNFCGKNSRQFSVRRFLWGISKLPTNKDLAFVTVPFSLMLRDIYADTSAKPCTCSEAINKLAVTILKYRGKRQVNTRVKGISHS